MPNFKKWRQKFSYGRAVDHFLKYVAEPVIQSDFLQAETILRRVAIDRSGRPASDKIR